MYATLKIPVGDEEQIDHVYKCREYLGKAGVTFDSGVNLMSNVFDWEFDWSLKGAKFNSESKELIFTKKLNQKRIENLKKAEEELNLAGVSFIPGFSESNETIVWNFSKAGGCEIALRFLR